MEEILNFGQAIEELKEGKKQEKVGTVKVCLFLFKQVPANVGIQYVPNMQSLPSEVKNEFVKRGNNLITQIKCVL